MRTIVATLAMTLAVSVGLSVAAPASAQPSKLTPAESKWITPTLKLWTNLNTGLRVVIAQATAKDALFVGSKNNRTLNATLGVFVTCTKTLKQSGTAPPRLTAFAGTMNTACARLEDGGHAFAKAIGAVYKGNSTLSQKLLLQGVGSFKKGTAALTTACHQLKAVGGKNLCG